MDVPALSRYRQIARQIKEAVEKGELTPGSRLPSSRTWAQELGVSRATVESAYGELVAQGWLVRRGQAGTFVSQTLAVRHEASPPTALAGEDPGILPFQLGLPALDRFPRALWTRVMGRRLRTQSRYDLALGDVCGERILRQAIVDYLRFSRSIDCQPEQIFITSGYAASVRLILQTLAAPGDGIWMEDPGFPLIRPVIEGQGIVLNPVPVDEQGMDIAAGIARYPQARFALLTPAHQSPLGVALSVSRRRALLDWAAQRQAWIIEDDYDSEFRYQGKPLPPLKSLDAPQRVIYAGTFSKSLFPAVRTAWLVVPAPLVNTFRQQASLSACTVPLLWQQTLADFITEGHFWRHLKKMRQCYALRHRWLVEALTAHGLCSVEQRGGIQLRVDIEGDDQESARRAREAGLSVQALSDWQIEPRGHRGLLISFTNLISPEMAKQAVEKLVRAIA
ncbi:MAG TPA: PLP-dependent aminotransferase family protein [Enterobacteriaceae bacterium]|nr:PLP-dependent aminotransferase family protein [Enterobacteriaceae bacterium]